MKVSFLATVLGFILCINSGAKIGESPLELMARYGEPTNPFALIMGLAEWNTLQGSVIAFIKDGSANLIAYRGGLSDALTNELLERNLPKSQKWVDGKNPKNWLISKNVELQPGHKFFEAADGSLWAIRTVESDTLTIGTPEAFELFFKLQERFSND